MQVSEIKLTYINKVKKRIKINESQTAYDILLESWDQETIELFESFKILLVNRANHVLAIYPVASGGTSEMIIDLKLIFIATLKANACGIILAHNHPTGNLKASSSDIKLTNRVKEGAKILDLTILDHIIVTKKGYYSFADEGIL